MGREKRNLRYAISVVILASFLTSWAIPPLLRAVPKDFNHVAAAVPPNNRFGIVHISYGGLPPQEDRYQLAKQAGASWNRWVFYWSDIETSQGVLNYTTQDTTVNADVTHGFQTLGVLMGTPRWATTAPPELASAQVSSPRVGQRSYAPEEARIMEAAGGPGFSVFPPKNLDLPVFNDNTDYPGPGKSINPNNYWARFVYQTALRYKGRVDYWEIWNEPDFLPSASTGWFGFWNGSVAQYQRLLKVAYLAVKAANPDAKISVGGMAYWFQPDFFPQLLRAIKSDPSAPGNGYYFDVTSWHWYSRASLIYDKTLWVKKTLESQGMMGKEVWITETNLPVCGDPVLRGQPACAPGSHRGTQEHQASFVLQAFAYGLAAGAEKIFLFQLFDDSVGPDEYYGLVRNDKTPRPSYGAYQVAATYLRDVNLAYRTPSARGNTELINLYGSQGQRIRVLWNAGGSPTPLGLPAEVGLAALVEQSTKTGPISSTKDGFYSLVLPPATLNDSPAPDPPDYIVGGAPYLLVEGGLSPIRGTIQGSVKNVVGQVVKGAKVDVGSPAALTDSAGQFAVSLLPGLYDVQADAAGYMASEAVLSVPVWGGRSTSVDLLLQFQYRSFFPLIRRRNPEPPPLVAP